MKRRNQIFTAVHCVMFLVASGPGWAKKQPPPEEPPPTPIGDFYFWRLGHMDGPHDSA